MVTVLIKRKPAFTLIELLMSISIIGLLMSLLMPSLSSARKSAKSIVCSTRLRSVGQGLYLYANDNKDALVPARLPKINDEQWRFKTSNGYKYRPTFLTMLESQIGIAPFTDPQASRMGVDKFGQPGDRQNYDNEMFLCPEVAHWTDERNGAYGYNYQFLGNARLNNSNDLQSYKNWTVQSSAVRTPSKCVAVADSIGTAASFAKHQRGDYQDNKYQDSKSGRSISSLGNEGFNLDPPNIDPVRGELASHKSGKEARTAIHERHKHKGNVLWMDGHTSGETLHSLGYVVGEDGIVELNGNNRYFSIRGDNRAWTIDMRK